MSRLRWLTKVRIIRNEGLPVREHLRYILLDPEVESYTYRVANVAGMLETIADATGAPIDELRRYVLEADTDPELRDNLSRRLRWRFDVKRRPELANRLGWYVLIRALRPRLIVETGIYNGFGSLTLLRALERNALDGTVGELISFDSSELAGTFVDRRRYPGWRHVVGMTSDVLVDSLAGRDIGALFQDSDHSVAVQQLEFGTALAQSEPTLLLVDASGGQTPVLEQLSRERGGDYRRVRLGATDHWYQRGELTFALFRTGEAHA
ncbi:MAG: class I SAM-dependent methyltransferase [Solirubrobacteraceae bacterium]